jgi:hypothetical protein
VVAVWVATVSVAVTGCAPEIAAGWLTEHVGGVAAPDGLLVSPHVSATVPVNPPLGVTVMFEVVEPPAVMGLAGLEVTANEGVEVP